MENYRWFCRWKGKEEVANKIARTWFWQGSGRLGWSFIFGQKLVNESCDQWPKRDKVRETASCSIPCAESPKGMFAIFSLMVQTTFSLPYHLWCYLPDRVVLKKVPKEQPNDIRWSFASGGCLASTSSSWRIAWTTFQTLTESSLPRDRCRIWGMYYHWHGFGTAAKQSPKDKEGSLARGLRIMSYT